jgi:hypothetical protein
LAQSPPNSGPDLSASDEALLLKQCGQSCVDDYRAAKALASMDVVDFIKSNGADILLEIIGVNDAERCFGEADVEGCLWTLVNVASIALVIGKIPAVSKAIVRVSSGVGKFLDEVAQARHTLDRLRKLLEALRKGSVPAQCLLSMADDALGVATLAAPAARRMSVTTAAAAGKFCMTSSIGKDSLLTRLARKSAKNEQVQKDFDHLFEQLKNGNTNPGTDSEALQGTGLSYARGRNGGRLFFRVVGDTIEIVAKSDKRYEDQVIERLKKLYGK